MDKRGSRVSLAPHPSTEGCLLAQETVKASCCPQLEGQCLDYRVHGEATRWHNASTLGVEQLLPSYPTDPNIDRLLTLALLIASFLRLDVLFLATALFIVLKGVVRGPRTLVQFWRCWACLGSATRHMPSESDLPLLYSV